MCIGWDQWKKKLRRVLFSSHTSLLKAWRVLQVLICTMFAEGAAVIDIFDVKSWLIDACWPFQILICMDIIVCCFEWPTKSHVKQCISNDSGANKVSFVVPQTTNWPRPLNIGTAVLWCVPESRCDFTVRVYCADKSISESGSKDLWHVQSTLFLDDKTYLSYTCYSLNRYKPPQNQLLRKPLHTVTNSYKQLQTSYSLNRYKPLWIVTNRYKPFTP